MTIESDPHPFLILCMSCSPCCYYAFSNVFKDTITLFFSIFLYSYEWVGDAGGLKNFTKYTTFMIHYDKSPPHCFHGNPFNKYASRALENAKKYFFFYFVIFIYLLLHNLLATKSIWYIGVVQVQPKSYFIRRKTNFLYFQMA